MLIHTEIPSFFSSNPGFPLLKFRFSCHRERFEIPITELIWIEIPRFKNGNYFIEITLWDGCSPVNLLHIFRSPFPKNTYGRLLLYLAPYQTFTMEIFRKNS